MGTSGKGCHHVFGVVLHKESFVVLQLKNLVSKDSMSNDAWGKCYKFYSNLSIGKNIKYLSAEDVFLWKVFPFETWLMDSTRCIFERWMLNC